MGKQRPNLMAMAIIEYIREVHPRLNTLNSEHEIKVTNNDGISFYISTDPHWYAVYRRNKHIDKRMLLRYSEYNVLNIIQLAIDILF